MFAKILLAAALIATSTPALAGTTTSVTVKASTTAKGASSTSITSKTTTTQPKASTSKGSTPSMGKSSGGHAAASHASASSSARGGSAKGGGSTGCNCGPQLRSSFPWVPNKDANGDVIVPAVHAGLAAPVGSDLWTDAQSCKTMNGPFQADCMAVRAEARATMPVVVSPNVAPAGWVDSPLTGKHRLN
jgi:hypothetical protein